MTHDAARPICPMCGEPGIHPSVDRCIEALRAAIDQATTQLAHRPPDPAIVHLGRWVPAFYP